MLDKKKNQVIFLFEFRICHKATVTSTMHLSQEYTVQWWFKTFCKVEKSLKDEGCSGQLSEVDNNQLRRPLKFILLKLHEKLQKNSTSNIISSFSIWRKLERWKSLINGCLMLLLFSWVWLFVTLGTVKCQASLSFTNSQTLLKLMSIEPVMPFNHLFLLSPFPPAFSLSQH